MVTFIEYLVNMWTLVESGEKQGFFFFISLYCLLVCSYSFFHQLNIAKWPSVKGKLYRANINKWGSAEMAPSNQQFKVSTLYTYQVNKQSYTGHRLSPWIVLASYNARQILKKQLDAIQHNQDTSINVFYNPHHPHKSFLIKPSKSGLFITLALAILPVFFYWLAFYKVSI